MSPATISKRTARPASRRGGQTPYRATLGARAFSRLRRYYKSDVDLAEALGVSRDTIRAWRHIPPVRPREDVRRRILRLAHLTREAEPYFARSSDVGRWTLAPQPRYTGLAPAELLRRSGNRGLIQLLEELVDVVPCREIGQPTSVSAQDLERALIDELGIETVREANRIVDVRPSEVTAEDLADFTD